MMTKLMTWFIELRNRFNELRLSKTSTIYVLNRVDDLTSWQKERMFFDERFLIDWLSEVQCQLFHLSHLLLLTKFQWNSIIHEELQLLKHYQSCFIFIIILFIKVKNISVLISNSLNSKIITFVTVISTVSSFLSFLFLDESMNLSFIIIIVQDKTLIVSEIKKICNKWKLCYYCKLQHLNKIAKECSNKKFFTLHIMNIYDSDIININEEVLLSAKKV